MNLLELIECDGSFSIDTRLFLLSNVPLQGLDFPLDLLLQNMLKRFKRKAYREEEMMSSQSQIISLTLLDVLTLLRLFRHSLKAGK